jgi:hypothetical protein
MSGYNHFGVLLSDFTPSCSPENGFFPTSHFPVALKIAVFILNVFLWAGRELLSSLHTFMWV